MASLCPQCAQPVTAAMRTCPQCGAILAQGTSAATGAPPQTMPAAPGFGTYTPPLSYESYAAATLAPPTARYPKAPVGARLVASILDGLVGAAGTIPGFLLIFTGAGTENETMAGLGVLLVVAGVLWALVYSFVKDGWEGGASLGKRLMGLMVVHLPSGRPCTVSQSALRALVLLALNCVPIVGWLLEPIWLLADADGRRLGDRAADTQVISVSDYVDRGP